MNSYFAFPPKNTFLYLLIVSMFNLSCGIYRTTMVSSHDPDMNWSQTIAEVKKSRPIIQVVTKDEVFDLKRYRLEDETLFGTLVVPEVSYKTPTNNAFSRNTIPDGSRRHFLITTHLFSSENYEPGEIAIPISEIERLQYYKTNEASNVFSSFTLSIAIVVISVLLQY